MVWASFIPGSSCRHGLLAMARVNRLKQAAGALGDAVLMCDDEGESGSESEQGVEEVHGVEST